MQTGSSTLTQPPIAPVDLSIIVPVRNDADRLRRCLLSIRAAKAAAAIELIVGDNGSTDASAAVAAELGAVVLSVPDARVAAVRNAAARAARGAALAFVDADHEIDPKWSAAALEILADGTIVAVGDQYHAPADGTWVQRSYDALRRHQSGTRDVTWLPSGNIVVKRAAFEQVGGFDVHLETCEDVDLCQRLAAAGGRIVATDRLFTVHYGDPRSLKALFLGELWRGRDNLRVSLRAPLTIRSIPSIALPVLDLIALVAAIAGCLIWPWWGPWLAVAGLIGLAAGLAVRMVSLIGAPDAPRRGATAWFELLAVSIVYDIARALALVSKVGHDRRRR